MYSQNNEEKYIVEHFALLEKLNIPLNKTFLDLGAYDGLELSNTRRLMELGWKGICVEPHPTIFKKLTNNCKDFKKQGVEFYLNALGDINGKLELNANDTYYSTLVDSELKRWENTNLKFSKIEVNVITFDNFLSSSIYKKFDFISIDCEGLDFNILTQIDLDAIECYMVCVETNGIETEKYIHYVNQFKGFSVLTINAENLIMGRYEL